MKMNVASSSSSLSLRQRLLQGGKSYGPFVLSDSPVVTELLAGIPGYTHIVLDMEHGPTSLPSCQRLLQAVDAANGYRSPRIEPIVRLDSPGNPAAKIKKLLDSMRLPGGVLIPMVETAAMAQEIVLATRYPQQQQQQRAGQRNGTTSDASSTSQISGIRGCAIPFVRASNWGSMSNEDYIQQCNNDLLVMVQVESPHAVEAIPDIAKVDGVDLIFIGPFDLSSSLGKVGQFEDPEVQTLLAMAEESVRESQCLLGGLKTPGVSLEDMFDRKGYSLVCGAVDLGLLRDAARLDAQAGQDAMNK